MKNLSPKIWRFLVSEDGPTSVEYAIMLALIISVCVVAIRNLGITTSNSMAGVNAGLIP